MTQKDLQFVKPQAMKVYMTESLHMKGLTYTKENKSNYSEDIRKAKIQGKLW